MYRNIHIALAFALLVACYAERNLANELRIVSGQPNDARLQDLKDLNGYFPFSPPQNAESWKERAQQVRRRLLVANGLWPMPPRGPVHAVVHGRVERDDYTVDRVYLESTPGYYVTGSLYRPKGVSDKIPAVLSPHGHYNNGRFHDHGESSVQQQIQAGGEKYARGGRHPIQARCVHLARMGCLVFQYDMVGYADSVQIPYELAHRHSDPRPEKEAADNWGFYSAQAEMRLQNIMGLQTFNSIRVLDWIAGLPEVDTQRIAVTGSSGGGTQTMMLSALDDRVAVSFPAVMVSTAMQGGCTCENATCLRVGTGNIEFAALFAPKPLGMTAADDWTKEIATKGYPELQQLYRMLGVPQRVTAHALTQFGHNYNYVSRSKMYDWLNEHLALGHTPVPAETDYEPLSRAEATVWNAEHPRPDTGTRYEKQFLSAWHDTSQQQLVEMEESQRRQLVRDALQTIVGESASPSQSIKREKVAKHDRGEFWEFHDLLRNPTIKSELPTVFFYPKSDWNQQVVLWISGRGKQSLFDGEAPRDEVRTLLDRSFAVAGIDMLYQGDFLTEGDSHTQTRRVENNRDFAGYTFGYNPTLLGHRVQDVMTLISFVRGYDEHPTKKIHLISVEGSAPVAVVTRALAGEAIDREAIDVAKFRFAGITSWRDPDFMPGAIKYGDVEGILAATDADNPLLISKKELADTPKTFSTWIRP